MLLWSRGPNTNLGRARKAYINPSLDLIGSFTWGPQFLRGSTSCTNFTRLSDSNRTTSEANVCLPRSASRFSKTPFAIEGIRTSASRDNELCCIQQAKKLAIAPGLLAHHKFIVVFRTGICCLRVPRSTQLVPPRPSSSPTHDAFNAQK